MKLEGKVALITGAGRNIGRAIALRFASEGADVIVNARSNDAEANAVADEVRALGRGGVNVVYFNDGHGRFEKSKTFGRRGGHTYTVAVADMNRDGALDIVVGNSGQKNAVFFTKSKGKLFQQTQFGRPETLTYGVAVADLNGDGYLDIAVANSGAPNVVYFGRPDEE